MFPYGDNVGGTRKAWVTQTLVVVITLIFGAELFAGEDRKLIIESYALYPYQFTASPLGNAYRLITPEFLHASLSHLIFNMCYLYAFGKTVEKILGSWIYLLMFLLLGALGNLVDVLIFPNSHIPRLGASGSISAIMGFYLVLAHWARIKIYLPLPSIGGMHSIKFQVPAWVILIFFILMQIYDIVTAGVGHVLYDVHIVCFLSGLAIAYPLTGAGWVEDNIEDLHNNPQHLL